MLGWAIRCAFLIALGVVAIHELDLDLQLPKRGAGTSPAAASNASAPKVDPRPDMHGSELTIPAGRGGHFFADAVVNGLPLRFMIDTGATLVILSEETAADLGIRPARSEYTVKVQTANGIIESAPVTLRQVQVGNFTARDVDALVSGSPLGGPLLGLSFLNRLQSYEVQRDRLVMRW